VQLNNGVKVRNFGTGDSWSNQHRKSLPKKYLLSDIDGIIGLVQSSENKLFMSFVPDNQFGKIIRDFGISALYDRKDSEAAIDETALSTSLYLHLARSLAQTQPIAPKFFYVVGTCSPWTMIEVDITSGKKTGVKAEVAQDDWTTFWDTLGISKVHDDLKEWISKK
jgi:hypothetical protein